MPRRQRRRRNTAPEPPTTVEPAEQVRPPEPPAPVPVQAVAVRDSTLSELEVLESSLSPSGKLMRDVIGRHLEEQGSPKPAGDPVLDVLEKVVHGIRTGTDISGVQAEVSKLISNQESRSELLDSLMMAHDYDRLIKYVRARHHVESLLLAAAQRGDLTPTEALAFMATITAESKVIQSRVKSGATSIKDIVGLLEKADYAVTSSQEDLGKKFKQTTPQGREIVRRLIHKLSKTTLEAQSEKAPGAKRMSVEEE